MAEPKLLRNFTINTAISAQTSSLLQSVKIAHKVKYTEIKLKVYLPEPLNQLRLIYLDKYGAIFATNNPNIAFRAKQQLDIILEAFKQIKQPQITQIDIKVL